MAVEAAYTRRVGGWGRGRIECRLPTPGGCLHQGRWVAGVEVE